MFNSSEFRNIIILILLIIIPVCISAKEFYISPTGSDKNPGTQKRPFATISHVKNIVRQWNLTHGTENITIWFTGGKYHLDKTVVFGMEDSAKPGQIITYSALPGEKPVICSDVPVTGWKKLENMPEGLPEMAKDRIWVAPVPVKELDFKVLFNSRGMIPRARTKAFAHLRKLDRWVGTDEDHTTIPFNKELIDDIFNPPGGEIVVVPSAPWTMNILPVESVDSASGMVHLGASSTYTLAAPTHYMGPEAIWVENTFAGLDSPGKWVCDKTAGLLYYWPVDNNKPGDDIIVPRLIEMFRIEGLTDYDGPTDIPVTGLVFKGLTFIHGNRFESSGFTGKGLQHDWERFDESTALLRFRGAENCRVENCSFIESGGTGIRLDLHARNIQITHNELSVLGGAGILLAGYGPGTKDVNNSNIISHNHVHHIGQLWWHSIAIWAWQSGHNLISHNTVHNVPYTAIAVTGRISWDKTGKDECSQSVRWHETFPFRGSETWEERERFLHGRQNRIENNDIHHVMEVMQDGNGIYISGAGHGNILCGNYIHDTPGDAAGEAIRCDGDQHETIIENNIIFHYGTYGTGICSKGRNHIFNNIVACPPGEVMRGMLSLESMNSRMSAGSKIYKNIFYAILPDQPFVFRDGMEDQVINTIDINNNIYYNSSDPKAADDYLEWAKKNGNETDSIQSDPLFEDAENGNFKLKPDSPAIKLGFRPFELNAGRIK